MARSKIEDMIMEAQRELKGKLREDNKMPIIKKEAKKVKKEPLPKTAKEQYKKLREVFTDKEIKAPEPSDTYEQDLIDSLFSGNSEDSRGSDEAVESNDRNQEESSKRARSGLWDYVLEDEIEFFDPECSYELTKYRPITETKGLDFNPEWFTEAGRTYTETGHYTEYPPGSKPYADYWIEQLRRCKEGYESHGYRISGDNYFFLNFYRMQTVQHSSTAGKGRAETFPSFHAKQYECFHYIELAEKLRKDICIFKARGLGVSEMIASLLVRPYITNKGYVSMLTAPDKPKLDNTKNKCWLQLNWLDTNTNGGMKHVRMKINNDDRKRASKVNSENVEYGWMSEIQTIIADTADKIRGSRVDRLVFEECLGEGTKVIMSDYSRKKIENIKVGDFVMGIDGTPQEVVSTCSGLDQLYKITQKKGDSYIVNSRHKLYLEKHLKGKNELNKIIELLTPIEYLNKAKSVKERTFGIKSSGLMFSQDNFKIDPYFFGIWIGDGFSSRPAVVVNDTDDKEISDYILSYFKKFDNNHITICPSKGRSSKELNIYIIGKNNGYPNYLASIMKEYNLINNKHIPREVYFLPIAKRLEILAGIIDTDGSIRRNTNSYTFSYEIGMGRKYLILEIAELARSCGFFVKYNERALMSGFKIGAINYRINIRGNVKSIPVRVKRKKIPKDYTSTSNPLTTGIIVTKENYGKYYGFTLRSYGKETDNLFLLNDYTICHNCGSNPILTKSWIQSNALVELGGEHFGSRLAVGTAGDDLKLDGLATMFSNPEGYNVLPYKNYDTEDSVPIYTSYFIPAHKFALIPKYLDNRGVTDSKQFKEFYEEERKKLSGKDLFHYCAEHPFNPQEALYKQGDNLFDSVAIADRLTQLRIQKVGIKPQQVDLLWDCPNADVNQRNKVKLVSNQQGKVFIYEPPLKDKSGNTYKNLYVAGIDSIDQGTGDSSTNNDVSDFCIVIKKRVFGSNTPNYVAIYKDRPKDITTAYEIAMRLLVYYNCKAMLEHTKISILMYFKSKKKENLFMTRPKSTMPDIRRGNSAMLGYPATETYLRHGLELINQFVNEFCYSIHIDEMLEQLLKYSWENKRKFDIVAAMIAAELGDEDLLGYTPRSQNEIKNVWKDFGWYYDEYGNKRYGIIP